MLTTHPQTPLLPRDLPAGRVHNLTDDSGVVLVCEHASAFIPPSLNNLGLDEDGRSSHAAWDIGALDMARAMSAALNAPLVSATVSRLVYDCNRPPDADSAMPAQSERIKVPGNLHLSAEDRTARITEIYAPFGALVTDTIARQMRPPAIVTVHSFTPVYHGELRETEIGLLHDDDPRLATLMLPRIATLTNRRVELNRPYSRDDGVTHTLAEYGTTGGRPSVMIEVRNDLVDTPDRATEMGVMLADALAAALADLPNQTEAQS